MSNVVQKRFRVLTRSWINNSLYNGGDEVIMLVPPDFKHGDNLEEIKIEPESEKPDDPEITSLSDPVE